MRYIELILEGSTVRNQSKIDGILKSKGFYWLIDSEIEEAKLEIIKDTIIWHDGIFYAGQWKYGIFKSGTFSGTWINGIFEGGEFKGKWESGINKLI